MRMDNETYRLKVEGALAGLQRPFSPEQDAAVVAELEELARVPRKTRHFLQALAKADLDAQTHFWRLILTQARREDAIADIERQIRHRYYEDREQARAMLAQIDDPKVLPALMRVIALTEEGWLAGELIRTVLQFSPEKLKAPLQQALQSKDYLLQCLAIYLVGKAQDDALLGMLAEFYSRPYGDKIDRLEKKAYDALVEGGRNCSEALLGEWLRDKHARVRDLAVDVAAQRTPLSLLPGLVGLLLVDAKTRAKTAEALMAYQGRADVRFSRDDASMEPVLGLLQGAKPEALEHTFTQLLRDENAAVRRVALKLTPFLRDPSGLAISIRRLAVEDHVPSVQTAALEAMATVDRERLGQTLVDLLSEPGVAAEVLEQCKQIMREVFSEHEAESVAERIKSKQSRREAAFDRFVSTVEWWRHDT